jgi:hypothetical protein
MSNKKASQNDVLLAIRMPKKLLDQLNALAIAKGIGTSTMARMTLIDYLRDEAPNALIGASQPQVPLQGKFNPNKFKTPAEQKAWEDEWDY